MTRNVNVNVHQLHPQDAGAQADEVSEPAPPAVQVRYPAGTAAQLHRDTVIAVETFQRLEKETAQMVRQGVSDREAQAVHRSALEGLNRRLNVLKGR